MAVREGETGRDGGQEGQERGQCWRAVVVAVREREEGQGRLAVVVAVREGEERRDGGQERQERGQCWRAVVVVLLVVVAATGGGHRQAVTESTRERQ